MSFREAFPDYPAWSFPPLPEGFEDSSWHHDACPSMTSHRDNLRIWLDYPNPAQRENGPSRFRFVVENFETGWSQCAVTWSEVLWLLRQQHVAS